MLKGYYTDIEEFPLQGWIDCNNGNLVSTRRNRKFGSKKNDAIAWETIFNDFLAKVDLNEEFKELIELMLERCKLQEEYILSVDENGKRERFKLNRINQITYRIQSILLGNIEKQEKPRSVTSILNELSASLGFQLRIKDLTTAAYFDYLTPKKDA